MRAGKKSEEDKDEGVGVGRERDSRRRVSSGGRPLLERCSREKQERKRVSDLRWRLAITFVMALRPISKGTIRALIIHRRRSGGSKSPSVFGYAWRGFKILRHPRGFSVRAAASSARVPEVLIVC